ncbi:GSK-3-binding protein-like [Ceratina calcarata]|uniref:GSK-3-binding protein-like n=1 Tax=Ceratina calcarata TaxID=156304 RepID=A0AAJ7J4B1_9HYME|nr:GSK-3-binding protein-like [Ceratina calcarata]
MPSAEETTYLIKVLPDTTQDFLSRDVDLLVSQIKENLRLSSLKAKSSISYKNRPSPYQIPSRSWADPNSCEMCGTKNTAAHEHRHLNHHHHHHHHLHHHKRPTARDDDPYELLQELLKEGGLIKEAVKRLQANLDDLDNSEEEVDDEQSSVIYRRKPYFYDSEDEQLPPVYKPLEL